MDRLRNKAHEKWTKLRHGVGFRPRKLMTETHFRYQSVHYSLIIGLTIVGSILIYSSHRGKLAYVDALFFAAGSCTQGGLNTIDLNLINTFSQIVIFFLTMLTNPIAIGYYTVSLRRYWFEKKLQTIVQDAKQRRGTISKSKSQMRNDMLSQVERGVGGRPITVMHGSGSPRMTNDGIMLGSFNKPTYDSHVPPEQPNPEQPEDTRRQPEIRFAGTVKKSDGLGMDTIKLPPLRTDEEHIAILERQRNRDDEVLRIPGPRDMERGAKPSRVDETSEEEDGEPNQPTTPMVMLNGRPQTITIEEPDRQKLHETPTAEDVAEDAKTFTHAFVPQINHLKFRRNTRTSTMNRVDEEVDPKLQRTNSRMSRRPSLSAMRSAFTRDKTEPTPYLSWEPTLGRNSQFHDLTAEQREELGGIEYRVLKLLQKIIICYFFGFYLFGLVGLLPWILTKDHWGQVVDNAGQSRVWWAFFTTNSAFMDLGYTLTPDSMNSFNTAVWPLMLMIFLIIIGNTGFPVMLRFIIWVMSIVVPRDSGLYEEVRFLLDHPRRCFILLFPSGATWWLFFILIGLNIVDVVFFVVLDLGSGPVVDLPAGIKVLNGLFEAASTRTAGFSCINLAALHPAVKVSYMIMMYISVLPIAMSIRRTNVYEEMSLGIYSNPESEEEHNNSAPSSDLSYIGSHLRRQLSFDLWFIALFWFMLAISEGSRIMNGETDMFALMFEIISAYGTVGMSLGYSSGNASLSAIFSTAGKVFIIMTLIRGRHRGLPYGLDRAIVLPKELDGKSIPEENSVERQRSNVSAMTTGRDGWSTTSKMSRRRHWRQRSNDIGGQIFGALLHPGPPRASTSDGHRHHSHVPHPQNWHSVQFGPAGTMARPSNRDSHHGSVGNQGGANGTTPSGWHSMRRRATNPEQHHEETIHEGFQFPPDRRPASDQTDQTDQTISDQNTLTEASHRLAADHHNPKLMKRKSEPSFPSTPTSFSE